MVSGSECMMERYRTGFAARSGVLSSPASRARMRFRSAPFTIGAYWGRLKALIWFTASSTAA